MKITLFYTLLSHSISKHIIVCDIYNNTSYLVILLEGYDHITRNNVISHFKVMFMLFLYLMYQFIGLRE